MIGKGLLFLTILSNCVLSLPVTSSHLENEDVKVMKCIVDALADVLSRPHVMPVSQECLVTLKTDDRLVTILRHYNFLKELQEIAVQGGQERVSLQRAAVTSTPTTRTLQTTDEIADRSMLEALGGPGERSILSQKERTENGDGKEEKNESIEDGESQEDNEAEEVKRGNNDSPGIRISESVDEWREGKAEKREEEEEEYTMKKAGSEETSEKESLMKDKKGVGSDEKRYAHRNKSKEKKFGDKDEKEKDKRSALFSHKHDDKEEEQEEEEVSRGSSESLKRWTKKAKSLPVKKKAAGKEAQQLNSQQEVPHHSKEVVEEEEEEEEKKRDTHRSPEEKELQMIARRAPEDRRVFEEEGSASRKPEEPEIESLAAIESELENVAQKLHELRRG